MKKIIPLMIVCFLLVMHNGAFAIDWHKVDSVTVMWLAPALDEDGGPLPAGATFSYDVFTKDVSGANIVFVGNVNVEQAVVLINKGEKKLIGAAAYYTDPDGIIVGPSLTAWSDVAADCLNGATFGAHNLKAPGKPNDLRK